MQDPWYRRLLLLRVVWIVHEARLIGELLEFVNVATAYKIQSQTFRHISFSLENTYQIKVRNVIIGWKTRFVVGTFDSVFFL